MPSASSNSAPDTPLVLDLRWQDPATVFLAFQHDPHLVWLDSQGPSPRARYSYLCVAPFEVHDGGSPFSVLDDFASRFHAPQSEAPVPFAGGAVGFLGYESADWLERVPRHANPGIADFCVGFYDVVFAWDHLAHRLRLISSGLPEAVANARAARARTRAEAILQRLDTGGEAPPGPQTLAWQQHAPRRLHQSRVTRAIAYIEAGDIYQANITARFSAARPPNLSPAAIHLALRAANPAPYGAFLACGKLAIASVSPERFLSLSAAGDIETRPIKGTARRAENPAEDAALASALLASAKDRAENLMIVDLLRNDIGRVASFGSVHVPELARLESFANIHHLVSCVRGTLRAGATAADLLRAAFPGGSITGAPKLRAMEIIHELEASPRGPYCGSIFWLGTNGAMDSSITIRTATITEDSILIQAGGGIVADSNPAAEYEEALIKARPLLHALGLPP